VIPLEEEYLFPINFFQPGCELKKRRWFRWLSANKDNGFLLSQEYGFEGGREILRCCVFPFILSSDGEFFPIFLKFFYKHIAIFYILIYEHGKFNMKEELDSPRRSTGKKSLLIVDEKVSACIQKIKSFYSTLDKNKLFLSSEHNGHPHPAKEAVSQVYEGVASIIEETLGSRFEKIKEILHENGNEKFQPQTYLAKLLQTSDLPPVPEFLKGTENEPIMIFFAVYFARPFMKELARRGFSFLSDENLTNTGLCPYCTSRPSLSFILKAQEGGERRSNELQPEGQRELWCHRCDFRWKFPRTTCPFCGNSEENTIGYLAIEGEPVWSISTCEACKGYIKTYDERALPQGSVVDEDQIFWSSVIFDILAQKNGYHESESKILSA